MNLYCDFHVPRELLTLVFYFTRGEQTEYHCKELNQLIFSHKNEVQDKVIFCRNFVSTRFILKELLLMMKSYRSTGISLATGLSDLMVPT